MWDSVKKLLEQKLGTILAIFGTLFVTASFCEVSLLGSTCSFGFAGSPNVWRLVIGLVFVSGGVALTWWEELSGSWVARRRVVSDGNGYAVNFGSNGRGTLVRVWFGRIEEIFPEHGGSAAVVLPANEFFDRDCYADEKTALGAFVGKHFSNNDYPVFTSAVATQLTADRVPTQSVEKETGVNEASYGVGTCVFLDRPAGKPMKMILSSVSTKRAKQGIRSEASFLFSAVSGIHAKMVDKRVDAIFLPLLGAGKGGLGSAMALFTAVIAFAEAITRPSGHQITSITIVVFQKDSKSEPEIRKSTVRRILGVGTGMIA